MDLLIAFGFGVLVGTIVGVVIIALCVAAGDERDRFDG